MSRYCTAAEVKLLIDTDLSDGDIESLIDWSDNETDQLTDGLSLGSSKLAQISARLTAIKIADRSPQSYSVGGTQMDYKDRIKRWRSQIHGVVNREKTRFRGFSKLEDENE